MGEKREKVYFMGIAGTGMASVAGLLHSAGYEVCGSDAAIYPPMSDMLASLGIQVATPYAKENLRAFNPDLVVVGNSLSRTHIEVEELLASNIAHTSFAALLGDKFLNKQDSIVVAGTHGKTTTTSLLAYLLHNLGEDPSFLVGGIPRNFPRSYQLGKGSLFVIEGDEYDTAFFDKGSKFLHYRPQYVLLNNIEFDHADIFADLAAVEATFSKLLNLVANPRHIIANVDDPGVHRLLTRLKLLDQVTTVATKGKTNGCALSLKAFNYDQATSTWQGQVHSKVFGTLDLRTELGGAHNFANICQALACLGLLQEEGRLRGNIDTKALETALSGFQGVKRRLEPLGTYAGITVFEDFAHHPTAVKTVIESFRLSHPKQRLIVAFEPKNATSRRNTFKQEYSEAFKLADKALIGACFEDARVPADQRMDTQAIAEAAGGIAFADHLDLCAWLKNNAQAGDAVIFMSCGSFAGIIQQFLGFLRSKASTFTTAG